MRRELLDNRRRRPRRASSDRTRRPGPRLCAKSGSRSRACRATTPAGSSRGERSVPDRGRRAGERAGTGVAATRRTRIAGAPSRTAGSVDRRRRRGDDRRAGRVERGEQRSRLPRRGARRPLRRSESSAAVTPVRFVQLRVVVDERAVERSRERHADRRLARSHRADEHDVACAAVPGAARVRHARRRCLPW